MNINFPDAYVVTLPRENTQARPKQLLANDLHFIINKPWFRKIFSSTPNMAEWYDIQKKITYLIPITNIHQNGKNFLLSSEQGKIYTLTHISTEVFNKTTRDLCTRLTPVSADQEAQTLIENACKNIS